jgi:hypothetical protein
LFTNYEKGPSEDQNVLEEASSVGIAQKYELYGARFCVSSNHWGASIRATVLRIAHDSFKLQAERYWVQSSPQPQEVLD